MSAAVERLEELIQIVKRKGALDIPELIYLLVTIQEMARDIERLEADQAARSRTVE